MHAAHLAALQDATGALRDPDRAGPAAPPLTRAPGCAGASCGAQRELARLAVAAESGALARVLASMSAGIAAAMPRRAGPSGRMTVEALQTALAAEHAALYVYGVLGARTSESARRRCSPRSPGRTRRTAPGATCSPAGSSTRGREPTPAAGRPTSCRRPTTAVGDRGRAAADLEARVRADLRLRGREHRRRRPALGRRRRSPGARSDRWRSGRSPAAVPGAPPT